MLLQTCYSDFKERLSFFLTAEKRRGLLLAPTQPVKKFFRFFFNQLPQPPRQPKKTKSPPSLHFFRVANSSTPDSFLKNSLESQALPGPEKRGAFYSPPPHPSTFFS
jgi:hypothetical protein